MERKSLPHLTALELAALASAALAGVQVRGYRTPLTTNEDGQTLTVTDTDGKQWLVWAPTAPFTEERFARHASVLKLLEDATKTGDIPFSVSLPLGVATRDGSGVVLAQDHPGGAPLKESDLVGDSLLASSLGSALAALHELPADSYASASRAKATAEQTRAAYRSLLETHSAAIPSRLLRRWRAVLDDDAVWGFDVTPLHGNLSVDSVYASREGAVMGICHFGSAAVGDPAQDLSWILYYADDPFLDALQAAYSAGRSDVDLHILTRAQLVSELATLRWYARGVAASDVAWQEAGAAALRELDGEFGDHWLVAPKPEVVEIEFSPDEEPLLRLQAGSAASSASGSEVREDDSGITEVISLD